LTPRHINAPADYWPQKVLAVSSVNAAMQNYVSVHEHQTRPNPALAEVHGQAGQGITPAVMKRCHWVEPVLVAQVKFTEWTGDNQLRQPVFLGLRNDKDPKDVVRE
jgi:ATP-dependent DNA ligase